MELKHTEDEEWGLCYQITLMFPTEMSLNVKQNFVDGIQKLALANDAFVYYANTLYVVVIRSIAHPNLQHLIDGLLDVEAKFA